MAEQTLYYGGQALIEGVMIRGPRNVVVACISEPADVARSRLVTGAGLGALGAQPLGD